MFSYPTLSDTLTCMVACWLCGSFYKEGARLDHPSLVPSTVWSVGPGLDHPESHS